MEDTIMRGQQLRAILSDIGRAVGASGGAKHAAAFDATQAALASLDDVPVGEVAARVEAAANEVAAAPWERRLAALQSAGISEPVFLAEFAELTSDKSIRKGDLLKIAQAYVGYADKKATAEKLLDAIKTRFY